MMEMVNLLASALESDMYEWQLWKCKFKDSKHSDACGNMAAYTMTSEGTASGYLVRKYGLFCPYHQRVADMIDKIREESVDV